jgi:ADP-L-glycero-D-manno-heptose 6-epimerase
MLLVTGAAGFIGSNVIASLNAQGRDDIIAVDDVESGNDFKNLAGKRFADYLDFRSLCDNRRPPKIKHLDGIIHLGAISDTQSPSGSLLMENNFTFSKRMVWLAEANECPLVYASSASVYGDGHRGFQENAENEHPKSPYAFSKWVFDQYVRQITTTRASHVTVPITGLRYFNVYGPGEAHKGDMSSFPYKCLNAVLHGQPVQLFEGSTGFTRDMVYISDVVAITLFFLAAKTTGIFNVGTGKAVSFAYVAKLASEISGKEISYIPFPEHMRAGYQERTQADITKLRVAGWHDPFVGIEAGIDLYWKSLTNRN